MNKRIEKTREKLMEKNIDAILITNPINRKYMTGFTGTAGIALITEKEALFITDFRYVEQAKEQAPHFTIIEHKELIELEIADQLKQLQVKRLGFETAHVTHAAYERYKDVLHVELVPVKNIIEDIRLVKSENELNIIKKAAEIVDDAFLHILDYIKPGVKEVEIANELEFYMRKKGATSSSFDIIVASGHRSALPHGVASNKVIEHGELVTMDFGAYYNNYCSDITRTVAVGEISQTLKTVYHTVEHAQSLGVEQIKAGMTGKDADAICRDYINEQGFGDNFGHSTGHGLGMEVHEGPGLTPKSTITLKPGMVVTVEPGVYLSNVGGCRIEDDIVITENGNRRLTNAPKHLIQL